MTISSEQSPLPFLAAVLARNGKPQDAWDRFEQSLGRGTWDDLSARHRWSDAEQRKQSELIAQLDRIDKRIEKNNAIAKPTPEHSKRREELLTQRRQKQDELYDFVRNLEKTYGPIAGQVFARAKIQAALPADAALIGWLDLPGQSKSADPNGEHWAVLLRSTGDPIWMRLHGSGDNNAWTKDDTQLPAQLRNALQSPQGDWRTLAQRLSKQRLDPVSKQLQSVRRLIVLPSTALAGVPVEILADNYTVSYAPSGTLYAYLHTLPKLKTTGLLALADPVFELPEVAERPKPLPPNGLLITMVAPRSNAAHSGLRPNDVLLRYNGVALTQFADLKVQPEAKEAVRRVAVTVWRDGKTFEKQLLAGKLGVVVAKQSAPQALAEQHKQDRRLASAARGGDERWPQLPGTRIEVEALRRLFDAETPLTMLTDSQASEQRLRQLAESGELGKFRYLHLATHGEVNERFPLRSAVILSRDRLPDAGKQLDAGLPIYDGRLTAKEVLQLWHLDSELVTLSACQTALGKFERGEGFVGFTQSLLLSGSRGVCLSLWKVDDTATALLMERFYENLLGKRANLTERMGKSASLVEAKSWLRGLSRAEALQRTARMSAGVSRGKGRKMQALLPPESKATKSTKEDRPYAHPYYWAAFVLYGDEG